MILAINDNTTLSDLQEKFNECFPHLKIEFYSDAHHWKELSPQTDQVNPEKRVGEVSKKHEHGTLEIKSWHQTGRVEQDFKKHFGLHVQIFRYENGKWIQSAGSDTLTLTQQSELINFNH
jgi:hypothetical protein